MKDKIVKAYPKVLGRLSKIEQSPKYKALSDEQRAKLRGHLFDKYMVPSYKARGLELPSRSDWINKHYSPPDNRMERMTGYSMSMVKGIGEMGEGLLSFSQWLHNAHPGPKDKNDKTIQALEKAKTPFKWLERRTGEYLGDHEAQGLIEKSLRFGSEEAPKFAIYHGANKLVGAGSKALHISELFEKGLIAPKVLKIIENGAEGYLVGHGLGEDEKSSRTDAAIFASFGLPGLAKGVGAKVGFNPFIIKFFKGLIGQGGSKLVEFAMDEGLNNATRQTVKDAEKTTAEKTRLGNLPKPVVNRGNALSPIQVRQKLGDGGLRVANDISKAYYNRLYHFLKPPEKEKVLMEVKRHLEKALETSVSDNPIVTKDVIQDELVYKMSQNPFMTRAAKLMGATPEQIAASNAEAAVEHNAIITGKKSIPKVLKKLGSGTVELPVEKEERKAMDMAHTINKMAGYEAPGAAHYQSPEFEKNLLNLIRTNFKLESSAHQLTLLWSMRREFPKPIQMTIQRMMERVFKPENGFSVRDYNKMVIQLQRHLTDVSIGIKEKIPEIKKHGPRIFKSTVIEPNKPKTKWQNDVTRLIEDLK